MGGIGISGGFPPEGVFMNARAVARLAHGCAITEIHKSGLYERVVTVELLEARIKKLEQFHCEHEFSDHDKGCTGSIFCSKCGALHPDWEMTFGFADDERPVGYLIVGRNHYRTKASKPKGEG